MTKIKDVRIMRIGGHKFRVEYQVENPTIGGFDPDEEWYAYEIAPSTEDARLIKSDLLRYGFDGIEVKDEV